MGFWRKDDTNMSKKDSEASLILNIPDQVGCVTCFCDYVEVFFALSCVFYVHYFKFFAADKKDAAQHLVCLLVENEHAPFSVRCIDVRIR